MKNPFRRFVGVNIASCQVLHPGRSRQMLHEQIEPFLAGPQRLLQPLLIGDVKGGTEDCRLAIELDSRRRAIEPPCLAIAGHDSKFIPGSNGCPGLPSRPACRGRFANVRVDHLLYIRHQEFLGRIAEDLLRCRI